MSKYNRAMDHVSVDAAMKARVMDNVQKQLAQTPATNASSKAPRPKAFNATRFLVPAACIVVLLVGAIAIPNIVQNSNSPVTPSSVVQVNSASGAASDAASSESADAKTPESSASSAADSSQQSSEGSAASEGGEANAGEPAEQGNSENYGGWMPAWPNNQSSGNGNALSEQKNKDRDGNNGEQSNTTPKPSGDTRISMTTVSIAGMPAIVYTGDPQPPSPTLVENGKTLKEGEDYSLHYRDAGGKGIAAAHVVNAGSYTVVAKGEGNYKDTQQLGFSIAPAQLENAKVDTSAISPANLEPTISMNGHVLAKGVDYDIVVTDLGKQPGGKDGTKVTESYSSVATGKGNYTGAITVTYTITTYTKKVPVKKGKTPSK